jgi:hypothetical protein
MNTVTISLERFKELEEKERLYDENIYERRVSGLLGVSFTIEAKKDEVPALFDKTLEALADWCSSLNRTNLDLGIENRKLLRQLETKKGWF